MAHRLTSGDSQPCATNTLSNLQLVEHTHVIPSDPGADQGLEAGRPDLHLSAAGREAGQVGSVNGEGVTDEHPSVCHRGACGPREGEEMLPGPIGDGHSMNTEPLPPPGLGPRYPNRAWHRVGVRELWAGGHTKGV